MVKKAKPTLEVVQEVSEPVERQAMYECSECLDVFSSHQGLVLHCVSSHGYRKHSSWYLSSDGRCGVCLTDLHSTSKLAAHLQYNGKVSRCLMQMTLDKPRCSEDICQQHQELMAKERRANNKAGNHVQYHQLPPRRLIGPKLQKRSGPVDCRPTILSCDDRVVHTFNKVQIAPAVEAGSPLTAYQKLMLRYVLVYPTDAEHLLEWA